MNAVDVTLLMLALTFLAAAVARRLPVPAPVTLTIAGIATGAVWRLIPGVPALRVPPERVLFVFLPPLLTAAAYELPLGGFRRNIRAIGVLAVGLVLVSMVVSAAAAHRVIGLSWATAFVLGAIVAPPDPVAATTVAGRSGLSHRLVTILEGEGLVNDATAIVAYQVALIAATTGSLSVGTAAVTLARSVPIGVLVGLLVGWAATSVRRHLNDVTLEAGISLLVPYAAYEVAERLSASGVLAVVTLGFVLQRQRDDIASPAIRLATHTVWAAVRFASDALVFFLVGILIGEVFVEARIPASLLGPAAFVVGTTVVVRIIWMFVVPRLLRYLPGGERDPLPSSGELAVFGWAGMRGVVSLALALALPTLPGSTPWGETRDVIILLTFAVIVVTLLVQGATLAPLIKRLGLGDPERDVRDERVVRARARRAGHAALARAARRSGTSAESCRMLAARIDNGDIGIAAGELPLEHPEDRAALTQVLAAQRMVLDRMRNGGRVGETLSARLATELDADAARVLGDTARLVGYGD